VVYGKKKKKTLDVWSKEGYKLFSLLAPCRESEKKMASGCSGF